MKLKKYTPVHLGIALFIVIAVIVFSVMLNMLKVVSNDEVISKALDRELQVTKATIIERERSLARIERKNREYEKILASLAVLHNHYSIDPIKELDAPIPMPTIKEIENVVPENFEEFWAFIDNAPVFVERQIGYYTHPRKGMSGYEIVPLGQAILNNQTWYAYDELYLNFMRFDDIHSIPVSNPPSYYLDIADPVNLTEWFNSEN